MKWHLAIVAVVVATVLHSAGGQTTQPAAEDPWARVVQRFAEKIVSGDADDVRSLLREGAVVRPLDSTTGRAAAADGSTDLTRLLAQAQISSLVGAHAYVHPPLVMAADIAVDCKNATDLPEGLRQRMIPQDDLEIKRANATAAQWLTQALGVADGDVVAVIVLFVPNEPLTGTVTPPPGTLDGELMFVLLKGTSLRAIAETVETGESAVIEQVVYGDPLNLK